MPLVSAISDIIFRCLQFVTLYDNSVLGGVRDQVNGDYKTYRVLNGVFGCGLHVRCLGGHRPVVTRVSRGVCVGPALGWWGPAIVMLSMDVVVDRDVVSVCVCVVFTRIVVLTLCLTLSQSTP